MYVVFLLIWIIFNGKLNLEILLFGLVIAGAVFAFTAKFMNYGIRRELEFYRRLPGFLYYAFVLIREILMANLNVCRLILSEKEEIDPAIVEVKSVMKTSTGRAFYANAITLTPGTITVTMEDGTYVVHCLDDTLAEGLVDSGLEAVLHKLEV